jgi:predicted phage baseplate assembly protein
VADSLVLEVEDFEGWQPWYEVDGFHTSHDDDAHYMLDRVTGTVTFGIKNVPQIGQRIRARSYQYGGGRDGNVSVDAINKISSVPKIKVRNPLPAFGGSDDETLAKSLDRIPSEIRRKDRAVTPGDFRELAQATPGAGIVRAETLELFRPRTRETNAAGVVSVMVLPEQGSIEAEPPIPTRAQLKQVCRWLDDRRLVTTEVYVIPPVYRSLAVAVGLQAKAGFSVDAVRVWVETVLRQYLSPLPPFGPYGEGWPLGRRVHAAELEAAVLQVEGVEYLQGLAVARFDESSASWVSGQVELELNELPWLLELTVVEGPPLEPGEAIGIPLTEGPLVPVPVVVEEC